tara:strand:+ start:590 stop:1084 length:495 start_codon:yes stop_codon:yes gene_type:complete
MPRQKIAHTAKTLMAKTEEVGRCMEWQGYCQEGVPHVYHRGRMHSVRRLLRVMAGKKVDDDKFVTPKCKNRLCVKLDHMQVVDRDGMVKIAGAASGDSAARGRNISMTKRKTAKLNDEAVRQIRASIESADVECLKHGVSRSTIIAVRANKLWKDRTMFGQLMR